MVKGRDIEGVRLAVGVGENVSEELLALELKAVSSLDGYRRRGLVIPGIWHRATVQ